MATKSTVYIALSLDQTPSQTVENRYVGVYDSPALAMELLAKLMTSVASGLEVGKALVFIDKGDGTQATGVITCAQKMGDRTRGSLMTKKFNRISAIPVSNTIKLAPNSK